MASVSVKEVPEGAQFIDVREPDEFAEVRAKGAKNIPMSEFTLHTAELDQSQPVYLICKSGGRSSQVAEYLTEIGYDAINVDGGTTAWVEAGLPHEGS